MSSDDTLRVRSIVALIVFFCVIMPTLLERTRAQKTDQLLVYGSYFAFSLKEPVGWKGDSANAEQFQANIILREATQPASSVAGLVRIRLNEKTDENISADLAADVDDYKARYPKIEIKDLALKNIAYPFAAKVFCVAGNFCEYVTYLNPGPGKPFLFSVSMNSQKSEATGKQLEAYQQIVASLKLLKP